jgi:hypothetical protein
MAQKKLQDELKLLKSFFLKILQQNLQLEAKRQNNVFGKTFKS